MENKAFNKALSGLSYEFAAKGAIRHLHDLGLSAAEIQDKLSYPLPLSRIEEEISSYVTEQESRKTVYDYEKTTDAYGRTSFRRIPRDGNS